MNANDNVENMIIINHKSLTMFEALTYGSKDTAFGFLHGTYADDNHKKKGIQAVAVSLRIPFQAGGDFIYNIDVGNYCS